MKAIILAGGFGTRLRPLSCTRPKLLFPVANKPLIDWTLENLSKGDVDEVILAVNYMADILEGYIGEEKYGMKISYSHEEKPLGTAGPLANAKQLLDKNDPFFVLNGDIISEVDYNKVYKEHEGSGGDLTIVLHEVEDPSRFGVAELDNNGKIHRFVEKPSPEEEVGKLVNAGIYVVEPSVIDIIEPGKKVSIEREVFPVVANRGKLYGSVYNGIWVDIGTPDDYLSATHSILALNAGSKNHLGGKTKVDPTATVVQPTAVGSNVRIGAHAHIGPHTAIGDNVTVGRGARIERSVIFKGAQIGNFSSIEGAIIGESATIGRWARIMQKVIVADHAIIRDNITLIEGVKVCHYKEVKESVLTPQTIM